MSNHATEKVNPQDLKDGLEVLTQLADPNVPAGAAHMFRGYAVALLGEIARLQYDLKIQNAVNDLAYLPHRNLVEQNDRLRARVAELEKARG